MAIRCPLSGALIAAMLVGLPLPAAAQFSPDFNHLKCYKINRRCPSSLGCSTDKIAKTVTLRDQFGVEQAVVLTPVMLCVPSQKICPDTEPCDPDPTQNPVDHFKCYKVSSPRPAGQTVVRLTDQFGTETVNVTTPGLLCTPVLKEVLLPTTTTTATTTTSTTTTTTSTTTTTTNPPCITGGCAACGTCGQGECHRAGGGGGCGAPDNDPVCIDTATCTATNCNSDDQCSPGQVCVFGPDVSSKCCSPCPAPCIAGGCAACGSCGHGECHRSGGGGGCGAPGTDPVCADTTTCTTTSCTSDAQCSPGRVCIFGPDAPSKCCLPCP